MLDILMPDPLVWEAGIEYGLQAVALCEDQGLECSCYVFDHGPLIEAVVLAAKQLNLRRLQYLPDVMEYIGLADLLLLPRVATIRSQPVPAFLKYQKPVVTSDPFFYTEEHVIGFERRNWKQLADILTRLSKSFPFQAELSHLS